HLPLVGDGDVDGPEGPFLQEAAGLRLGGQGVQLVRVAAQPLVDDLGVRVTQPGADQSVFHGVSSSRQTSGRTIHPSPQRAVSRSPTARAAAQVWTTAARGTMQGSCRTRSEEHTSELQS